MSRTGAIDLVWGDGEYTFRLPIGQLRELQEKTGVGPGELADRMLHGKWRIDDLRETLRLGLIGGGMEPTKATVLIRRYFDDRPLLENVKPAHVVLLAALVGSQEEPVGKEPPPAAATETDGSNSPPSTDPEP
jgi:hypothetical protein